MKTPIRLLSLLALTGTLLSGCVVVPSHQGGYYRQPVVYGDPYPAYRAAPAVVYPAPRFYEREYRRDRW